MGDVYVSAHTRNGYDVSSYTRSSPGGGSSSSGDGLRKELEDIFDGKTPYQSKDMKTGKMVDKYAKWNDDTEELEEYTPIEPKAKKSDYEYYADKYGLGETEEDREVNDLLRYGEQASSALQQGLSFGWADEMEGVLRGVGYGLGSLNPDWNRSGESFLDAMGRGYLEGRDYRRQNLEEGREENPMMMAGMEMLGAAASPVNKLYGAPQRASLGVKVAKAKNSAIPNGIIYGTGSATNDDPWSYATNIASGAIGNYAGNELAQGVFGRGVSPLTRDGITSVVGQFLNSAAQRVPELYIKKWKDW